jgi:hypothetical protein
MREGESITPASPRKSKFKKIFFSLVAFIVLAVAAERIWYHHTFPYGWSHACSKGLMLDLTMYAQEHEHWLPYGEPTPEASLGLLYTNDLERASWMLGGKTIQHDIVKAQLEQARMISPDKCGWHYIEGLRDDDDPQIAVAWDKAEGLGHNGQRWPDTMHEVVLISGTEFISKKSWPQFLVDQKKRLAEVIASRGSNAPPIRWSDVESLGTNRLLLKVLNSPARTAASTSTPR